MGRSPSILTLAVAGMVLAAGCTASPWSADKPPGTQFEPPQVQPAAVPINVPGEPASGSGDQPNSQALQEVMAELQQLGALDPAAREKLMADMRQTDPKVWPDLLRVFRASAAYRRRADQEGAAAANHVEAQAAGPASAGSFPRGRGRPTLSEAHPSARDPQHTGVAFRLPVADADALPPRARPGADYPSTRHTVPAASFAKDVAARGDADAGRERVIAAGYDSGAAPNWRDQLAGAIAALQSDVQRIESDRQQLERDNVRQSGGSSLDAARKIKETLTAKHAQLRILYLLAGRREDAMQPIPEVVPAVGEFWTAQCYSLDTLLDLRRNPDAMVRARQAKRMLGDAVARLGETAPLVVQNLAFCTKIESYGRIKKFSKNEFAPNQEVLLYAEVENSTSESTSKGYHTSLRSSYQIFDSRNRRVADHQFTTTEEHCQRPRRDYFIGYHLRLPSRIYPGKHTLQLTVEDLKSQKVAQSSIELTVKNGD